MARTQISSQDFQELRDLARQWGKIIARRVAPDAASVPPLDFAALEDIAQAAAAGLTEGTLDALLDQQARRLPDQVPCPACGRLCLRTTRPRPLVVRTGQTIRADEPVAHCPDCRRDFFPPTAIPPPGQPPVLPRSGPPGG